MNAKRAVLVSVILSSIVVFGGLAYASDDTSYSSDNPIPRQWEQFARRGSDDFGFDDRGRGRHRGRGRGHFEDDARHRSDDHHHHLEFEDRDGDRLEIFDDNGHHHLELDDSGRHG